MLLNWLMNWYNTQCDGNWEHDYGILIETTDNPGWSIEINLQNTSVNDLEIPWGYHQINETSWYGYKIENSLFTASCSPLYLENLITIFKDIVVERET